METTEKTLNLTEHFTIDRPTKGTVLYKNLNPNSNVVNVYVKKGAFADPDKAPKNITLTLTDA